MSDSTIKLISLADMKKQYWDQYNALVSALKETAAMLTALGETVPSSSGELSERPSMSAPLTQKRLSMTAMVRKACESFSGSFTRADVIDYISKNYPEQVIKPASISAMLSAMASNGGLIMLEGGTGGALGLYEVPNKKRGVSSTA